MLLGYLFFWCQYSKVQHQYVICFSTVLLLQLQDKNDLTSIDMGGKIMCIFYCQILQSILFQGYL